MPQIITTCTRDCPNTCGPIAEVENGRVTALRGNPLAMAPNATLVRQTFEQTPFVVVADLFLLTCDRVSRVGNGATYYDTRVRIYPTDEDIS